MKTKINPFFVLLTFCLFLINTTHTMAQGHKASPKNAKPTQSGVVAITDPSELKGTYVSNTSCADLVVKKGCVKYTISTDESAVVPQNDQAKSFKVCYQKTDGKAKPTNICPGGGASKFKVFYEKADKNTQFEFTAGKTR